MNKFLLGAAALVLASCAGTPPPPAAAPPAPPAAAQPAAEAAPPAKPVSFDEALPVLVQSQYANGDSSGTVRTQYDARGQLVLQETFNGNGVLVETRSGKAKGTLWRITVTNAQTGEVSSFEDRNVGAWGQLLTQTFLNPKDVPQASNEYVYDAKGRKTQWSALTGTGGLQAKTLYNYDTQGRLTKTLVYDAGGTLTNTFETSYDAAGNAVTRKGFDAAGNLVEQTNFTWKDGKKIKEETVKPLLRTLEYSYADRDAPTVIVSSVRNKVVERQTLTYQWFTRTLTNP